MTQAMERRHTTTLRLDGEVGREQNQRVRHTVLCALRDNAGDVWLDLRTTCHLHYEVARTLVETARNERRLHFVGASPYVQQILYLMGGADTEVVEDRRAPGVRGDTAA